VAEIPVVGQQKKAFGVLVEPAGAEKPKPPVFLGEQVENGLVPCVFRGA
jgi:hypothetical protein